MHNEKETIRVVYCEPGRTSRITEIGSSLEDLQRAVGGGLIEPFYPFEEEVCLVVNEEGKFNGMRPNRAVYDEDGKLMDIIFGPFFICDCSGENFGSLSDEQAEKYRKQFELPENFVRTEQGIKAVPYRPLNQSKDAR